MSSQPVEANVVLTADNTQYDQSMNQSSTVTSNLGQNVDTLGSKISKLTKTAGKSLIGISAADIALIGGATAAWSSYEKQVTRLQAQSAVLGRTTDQQNKLLKDYTASVKALRTEYGVTTTEAANLVQTLSKVTAIRQSRDLKDLSKVFVDMSNATGESSEGLASSLTNLQKLMGTPISAKTTRQYADQFTYLAAQTNTSAQGLIDFTATLAPAGRQIGLHSDQMAGWATAFAKAGQDSGPAAQVFTKITTDIAHSMATGSPEIAHYANLLGVTKKQFKELGGDEQVLQIFEKLQSQGKGAATELNRLQLDGPRSIRAIQSVLQGGSLRETLGLAESGKGAPSAGAAKEGSDATANLSREMAKLRDETEQLAETFGSMFGPAIEGFVKGMTKAMELVNEVASGPMGQMIGWVMKLVAPLAAGAGAILLFAGALLKLAGVFTLFRNSLVQGGKEGLKGGGAISGLLTEENQYLPRGDREIGAFGQKLAGVTSEKPGTWLQRAQYNLGNVAGRALRAGPGALVGGAQWAWEKNPLTDYTRTPGPSRGLGSYLAGGLGRTIDATLTPSFDQMRYDDPTKRTAGMMMGQIAPWTTAKQRLGYVGALATEHLAGRQLGAIGEEQQRVRQEPLITDAARETRMAELEVIENETKARKAAATESKAALLAQIEAQKLLTAETSNTTVGMGRLQGALGRLGMAGGGGMLGAAKLGGQAFMRSGMAWPVGGMVASLGAAEFGGDSKTLQYGAMGAMMGPWGAGIGAGVGAVMDTTAANDKMSDSVKALTESTDAAMKTGYGLTELNTSLTDSQSIVDKTAKTWDLGSASTWFGKPKSITDTFGALKSGVEGVFGRSDITEARGGTEAQRQRILQIQGTAQDLAKAVGTEITGTAAQQRRKLDAFMSSTGAQRFETAGVDPQTLVKARAQMIAGGEGATKAYQDLLDKVASSQLGPGVEERLSQTAAGQAMAASPAAQRALVKQEDVQASYKAVQQIYDDLKSRGKSDTQIMHAAAIDLHQIGNENSKQFELQMGVYAKAQQNIGMQTPLMTRTQQFQSTIAQMGALATVQPTTPAQRQLLETQKQQTAQGVLTQVDYVKQMLLMQDQYEISRKRAQDDYAEQQSYQLHDYNLQRTRAEYQFNLSRGRATADYYRSVRRANTEWDLQRKRQEQDFNHQTNIAAQQMANSVYNVYQRVQVQRTSSAEWLIANAHDQLIKMQEQEANLKKLRREGLSDAAIQAMQLTDPAQAQEAARLAASMTRTQIQEANKVMGAERQKAAKDLFTDPSGLDQQERQRQYRRARAQNLHDHNVSMRQSREDFFRQLKQQKQDFNTMMDNQDTDFQTSVNRQEKAYKKSMNRSAEDLANAGKEISGSIESILKQGSTHLTGYAQDTAAAALKTFQDLKTSTRPVAIAIMKDLSDIFGFEYKAPKLTSNNVSSGPEASPGQTRAPGVQVGPTFDGGVMPGWTPGRDVLKATLSGGEAVMRPEWARAVGEKKIDEMNHKARYGGFAKGGVVWPLPHSSWSTYPGHDGIDLNAPNDYGKPFYAAAPGKISYTGWNHGYGDAVFESGPYGTLVYGHGSKVAVHAGQMVTAGQYLGNVGSTGHSTGPHLHIGFPGGTSQEILSFLHGAGHTGYGAANAAGLGVTRHALRQILKDRYPSAEKAAYQMQGEHPLFPGDISKVINRMAHSVISRLRRNSVGAASGPSSIGNEPNANLSNEGIVHVGANRMGWGDQWGDLRQIVMHESGFRNTAQNPTSSAYGMFQFLDSTWGNYGGKKTSDPWRQTQYGLKYIKDRYKDPHGAWNFWQDHNWYADGSVFTSPRTIGVGERGPEAVIPLNDRGGEFLTKAMLGADMRRVGMGSSPAGRGLSVFNTRIDKSTNFTGPITVQANDPNELLSKLQARQRVMALSRPSLTGSAA